MCDCRDIHSHIAFFGDADNAHRLAGQWRGVDDHEAFVECHFGLDAARLEQGDAGFGAGAEHFFVMPEHEKHRTFRLEARGRKGVCRLHQSDKVAFVVDRAAAIDIAVDDLAGERRPGPVRLCAHVDGDDVLVRHQQDRFERRIAASPRIQQGQRTGHDFACHGGVGSRIGIRQPVMKCEPFAVLARAWIAARQRDRLELDDF